MELCFLLLVEPLTRALVARGVGKADVVRSALTNFCRHGLASGWAHNAIQARPSPPLLPSSCLPRRRLPPSRAHPLFSCPAAASAVRPLPFKHLYKHT